MLSFKKLPRRWICAAGVLSVVLVVVLATNPATVAVASPPSQPSITVTELDPPNEATAVFVATAEPEQEEISFIWPLVNKGYILTSKDGYRGHTGVDIAAPEGTEIVAAQDGVVSYAVNYTDGAYGKRVDIDHGDGYMTRYGHCSEVLVEEGQRVEQGTVIAKVGRTGNAYGNHCHFEIRYNEDILNPEDYIGSEPPKEKQT